MTHSVKSISRVRRMAWYADLHLGHVAPARRMAFIQEMAATACDDAVITGDIGEANTVATMPSMRAEHLAPTTGSLRPLYVVLGNHDYFGGAVEEVRRGITELLVVPGCRFCLLCRNSPRDLS